MRPLCAFALLLLSACDQNLPAPPQNAVEAYRNEDVIIQPVSGWSVTSDTEITRYGTREVAISPAGDEVTFLNLLIYHREHPRYDAVSIPWYIKNLMTILLPEILEDPTTTITPSTLTLSGVYGYRTSVDSSRFDTEVLIFDLSIEDKKVLGIFVIPMEDFHKYEGDLGDVLKSVTVLPLLDKQQ